MSWMFALALKFATIGQVAVAFVVHGATGNAAHDVAMMLPLVSAWQYCTPSDVIDTLNKAVNAALADPKLKSRIGDLGGTMLAGSPADFGKLIAEETEKWGKVVKFAGIKQAE